MIDNIKSIYFIKIIFSYVDEKRKLKIIKYNKNIKNKLDIHLVNYKFLSGKYVIFDPNGKGKEYDYRDNLVFEGEYLKGERNGKGKEYEYGKLLFEGEYINGKRNGKGKEYYYSRLIFDGEYLDGKRNGKGKEYYRRKLVFEGEYSEGNKWEGKGYDIISNKIIYEMKGGKGNCREYEENHLIFEGEYLNGKRNGKGKEYIPLNGSIRFEGEYLNGKRNGYGIEYNTDKQLKYEGEYKKGKLWNGKGYYQYKKEVYELIDGKGFFQEYDSENGF